MQSATPPYFQGRRAIFLLLAVLVLLAVLFLYLRRNALRNPSSLGSVGSASNELFPTAIAADQQGNLYVAMERGDRILRISSSRQITIAAGKGIVGYSGDGGEADRAELASPAGIAVDPAGNLFIADTRNDRIRRVDAQTHIISTVAGNGKMGGRPGLIATSTGLYLPVSVAADQDGNLYIGAANSDPIRRVDAITHMSSRVIGADNPGNSVIAVPATGPFWVAMAGPGTLLFSDANRNSVSLVDLPRDTVHIIAGGAICGFSGDGQQATGALMCFPEGLAFSPDRKLFIADTGNNRIRQIDLNTGIITTVAGNGEAGYSGDGGPAVNASLKGPMGIAVDEAGNLYIADTGNNCIRRVETKAGRITTWSSTRDLARASSATIQPAG
jgi:trimeric autotransporter adhesin